MGQQQKGNLSINYGGVVLSELAENSITYEIGESGDTISALDAVVHVKRNKNAIVSSITVTVVKGAAGLAALLLFVQTDTNAPLAINDEGMGVALAMSSANMTQIEISDTVGSSDVETVTFTFKGNLQIISL